MITMRVKLPDNWIFRIMGLILIYEAHYFYAFSGFTFLPGIRENRS